MQRKRTREASHLHQLPVALSRRFHRCLRERLSRYHFDHYRWDPIDVEVSQHPVCRFEEQREADKFVSDEVSHRRRRLVLFSNPLKL